MNEINIVNENNQNKIRLQNDITIYMHWALPLCMVLGQDRFLSWYYEHFIQIVSIDFDNTGYDEEYLWADFLEASMDTFKNQILFKHYNFLAYNDVEKIKVNDYVINKLNLGYFCIIYVDEFYIPVSRNFQNRHFVHPILIYEFDNLKNNFLVIGLNSNFILDKFVVEYDALKDSFDNGKTYFIEDASYAENEIIQFYLPSDNKETYSFNIKYFLEELKSYILASGDNYKMYIYTQASKLNKKNVRNFKFGLDIYNEIINKLNKLLTDRHNLDYRVFHLLYEHKKGLYQRLQYILSIQQHDEKLEKLIQGYSKIVKQTETLKTIYMKQALIASKFKNFYKLPSDPKTVNQLIDILKVVKIEEERLLNEIYYILSKNLK